MTPTTPICGCAAFIAMGIGMAFIWSPLAATATHLPAALAGAGSGVYNATRQVGASGQCQHGRVHDVAISAEMPGGACDGCRGSVTKLPVPARAFSPLCRRRCCYRVRRVVRRRRPCSCAGFGDRRPARGSADDGPENSSRSPQRSGSRPGGLPVPGSIPRADYFPDETIRRVHDRLGRTASLPSVPLS